MKKIILVLLSVLLIASACYANEKVPPAKRVSYSPAYWDDIFFPASQHKVGSNTSPAYDETNLGLTFPANDETAISFINAQIPHLWKGTAISPHVHIAQAASAIPVFAMAYRWYAIGGRPTGNFTIVTTNAAVVTYVAGTYHQLLEFPDITPPLADMGSSSIIDIKLYRKTGDGAASTVLLKNFDIHLESDQPGSRTEYTK